jgi:hypothetical protein
MITVDTQYDYATNSYLCDLMGYSLITPSLYFINGKHCGGVPKSKQLEYIYKEPKRSPVYKKREKRKATEAEEGGRKGKGKEGRRERQTPKRIYKTELSHTRILSRSSSLNLTMSL